MGGGNTSGPVDVSTCLTRHGNRQDFDTETFIAQCITGNVTHTLKAEGHDASEDGTGRGTPIIAFDPTQVTSAANRSNPQPGDPCHTLVKGAHAPVIAFPARMSGTQYASTENLSPSLGALNPTAICFSSKDHGADACEELAPTLRACGHDASHANAGAPPAVAYPIQEVGKRTGVSTTDTRVGIGIGSTDDPMFTLQAGAQHGVATVASAVAFRDVASALTSNYGKQPDNSDTGLGPNLAGNGMRVRRLTPRECERLQGFPDDYTLIPHGRRIRPEKLDRDFIKYQMRGNPKHLTRDDVDRLAADGPRYKALGNSWAVVVGKWIGQRIELVRELTEAA